ncbi:hypothetical protein, partial [Streptomyces sp. NPDC004285]
MSVRKQFRAALCGLALTAVVVTTAQGPAAAAPVDDGAAEVSAVSARPHRAARYCFLTDKTSSSG